MMASAGPGMGLAGLMGLGNIPDAAAAPGMRKRHGADGDAHEKRLQRGRRGEEIVALLAEGRNFQI